MMSRLAAFLYGASAVFGWHVWQTRGLAESVAMLRGAVDTLQTVCR